MQTNNASTMQCGSICDSCNMGTSDLPDIYERCPRVSADISGKSRVRMLQLLYNMPSSNIL